jgi:hypothetical protein
VQALETPQIAAVVVQDNEGGRIVAKYFPASDLVGDAVGQTEFEKRLFKKTRSTSAAAAAARQGEAEIQLLDGMTVVYKTAGDVTFFVVGDGEENELILTAVLDALHDAIAQLLKGLVDKRMVMNQVELLMLCIDELVDGGVPFELDAGAIEARVMLRGAVPDSISSYQEMTLGQLADKARDKLAKQWK